jgi:small nuclear ribonucleoprotein (snRNP)-like protein
LTRFDLLFTKYIGRDITVLLSGARVVKGRLLGVDRDYGLALETKKEFVFLNGESVVIEGFAIDKVGKKIRKRKGKKEKRLKR